MASANEPWTIGRLLTWTAEFLKSRGSESPRLDAELLLAHATGRQRIQLYTAFGEVCPDDQRAAFRALVKQRAEGRPVAYLLGRREFYSLDFEVTPDVLIPRPETEHLVVRALDLAKGFSSGAALEIVDVGVGSGAIAVTLARHLTAARVTAVDISPAALAVARRNAERHGVLDRVTLRESDLLAALPAERKWQFVVSNPPYVSEAEYGELARDVRDFEPRAALVGGPTGAETIARLVPQAAERLVGGGWLILEISPQLARRVHELLAADGRFEPASTMKDLAGLARIVSARRSA